MWPDWNLTPRVRLRLAKRPSLHVRKHLWKHAQSYIRLHRRVRRPLRLNLNLDLGPNLNLDLNLNLGHPLFETLSRQSFASSFGSMFGSKFVQLYVWMDPALCRQKLGGRQPVGRGVGGRIVVRCPADTIPCGADNGPFTHARVIRLIITRVLSPGCVAARPQLSVLSRLGMTTTYGWRLGRNHTTRGTALSVLSRRLRPSRSRVSCRKCTWGSFHP